MIIGQSLARLWIVPDRQSMQRESTAEIMTRWYNSFAPPHGEFSLALPKQLMHHHVPPFELFNKHVLVTSSSMYMTDFITLYHGLLNGLNLGLAGLIIMENLPLDHNEFALAVKAAPNNNNRWIEWDVPLGGEIDEPMVDPEFDEEEIDDDDGWEEDDEWLMASMTPPRATVTVSSTYEVGGPSMATPVGHPLAIMAPGVATQPQVIDDLCTQMDNLEYRHGALTRRMEAVSDIEVANSTAIREIHPRVTTVEKQVQTLQAALHGAELQNQQL
ncbi:hypothetical protein Tco_1160126 [Tanacetum coccineum]